VYNLEEHSMWKSNRMFSLRPTKIINWVC